MTDETPGNEKTIADELSKLGKQLGDAAKAAWESEDRKRLQADIEEGLRRFSQEASEAVRRATESDSARQVKTQAQRVATEVKEHDVADEVRKGLVTGLEVINRELGKLLEKLESKKAPEEPPAAPEPPAEPKVES